MCGKFLLDYPILKKKKPFSPRKRRPSILPLRSVYTFFTSSIYVFSTWLATCRISVQLSKWTESDVSENNSHLLFLFLFLFLFCFNSEFPFADKKIYKSHLKNGSFFSFCAYPSNKAPSISNLILTFKILFLGLIYFYFNIIVHIKIWCVQNFVMVLFLKLGLLISRA